MLSSFTWTHFFLFVGCSFVLWSLYVLYLSKRNPPGNRHPPPEKKVWYNNQQPQAPGTNLSRPTRVNNVVADAPDEEVAEPVDEAEEANFRALEDLATEITLLVTSEGKGTTKEQLTVKLQEQIARYPTLQDPAFRTAISNLVIRAANKECGIEYSDEEVRRLWPVTG